MNRRNVLQAYDEQLRRSLRPPAEGWVVEQAAGVVRMRPPPDQRWGYAVVASDLDAGNADDVIAAQVAFFGGLGREFEWKWHGYDQPADLPERLVRAGFEPEERESLVVGEVDEVVGACGGSDAPGGVTFRRVELATAGEDFAAIGRMKTAVCGGDPSALIDALRAEWRSDPAQIIFHVAEADGGLVSAGWVRFHADTDFASLWGGGTLPQWRRRGIYRHLVQRRAHEAAERGYRYLQVDASDESLPILQRLGLVKLTDTTPYIWKPPAG